MWDSWRTWTATKVDFDELCRCRFKILNESRNCCCETYVSPVNRKVRAYRRASPSGGGPQGRCFGKRRSMRLIRGGCAEWGALKRCAAKYSSASPWLVLKGQPMSLAERVQGGGTCPPRSTRVPASSLDTRPVRPRAPHRTAPSHVASTVSSLRSRAVCRSAISYPHCSLPKPRAMLLPHSCVYCYRLLCAMSCKPSLHDPPKKLNIHTPNETVTRPPQRRRRPRPPPPPPCVLPLIEALTLENTSFAVTCSAAFHRLLIRLRRRTDG